MPLVPMPLVPPYPLVPLPLVPMPFSPPPFSPPLTNCNNPPCFYAIHNKEPTYNAVQLYMFVKSTHTSGNINKFLYEKYK